MAKNDSRDGKHSEGVELLKMNIAYIGTMVDPETIMEYSGGSIAGNKFQWGITSQVKKAHKFDQFIVLPYASFPRTKKIIIANKDIKKKSKDIHIVPYLNIFGIKQLLCMVSLTVMLGFWAIKTRKIKDRIMVIYNTLSFMCIPVLIISKLFSIKKVGIIADLPPKNSESLIEKLESKFEINSIRQFDGVIQITKHITKDFATGMKNIIIEGGIFKKDIVAQMLKKDENIILYTGALDDNSGIEFLLEAFKGLKDKKLKLLIAGSGKFEKLVRDYSEQDERINYIGYISNHEAVSLQNRAHILVCPRMPDGYITKYTFPSKIMEYLLTGGKVVCFALEGIPEEYAPFILISKENSIAGLKDTLQNALLSSRANNTKQLEFINEKSWENKSYRVIDFLEELLNHAKL